MKKMILLISVAMIGSILVLTSNSFAGRERGGHHHYGRGGHYQKWNKPVYHKPHYSPAHRFRPKYRPWRHRPVYRPGHPRRYYRGPHHTVVQEVNNYYSSAEGYAAPEDEFTASASISDTGFSFSVGVSRTDWSHNLKKLKKLFDMQWSCKSAGQAEICLPRIFYWIETVVADR